MPAPARALRGTAHLGRYELVRRLARGELTDLWLARVTGAVGFARHVVVKQVRPDRASDQDLVHSFLTEARIAGGLHHQHIAAVQDVGEDGGQYFFAMEYIHGESLRHMLARLHARKEQMPLAQVLAIVSAVASALHHAHEVRGPDKLPAGVVHRAVTPGNILVGYDGCVKVVDFGIIKAALRGSDKSLAAGRVPYMPPEECTGQYVDRRADIHALGVVLHEAVTGRRLFRGETDFLTMSAIAHGIIPRASHYRKDLPAALEAVISKALARLPADRFQTAEELRLALEPIAAKLGPSPGLAAYVKQLFGARGEPWHDATELAVVPLDFDDRATGLAAPPADAIEAFALPAGTAKDAPLVLARARAMPAPATALRALRPPPMNKADITKVDLHPPAAVATAVPREPTQMVSPLPIEGEIRNDAKLGRGRYLWLGGTALAATAAVAYFLSASAEPRLTAAKPVEVVIKPAPQATPPVKEQLATIPWEQRTAANSAAPSDPAPDLASLPDDVPAKPGAAASKPAPEPMPATTPEPMPATAPKPAPEPTPASRPEVIATKAAPAPKPEVIATKVAPAPKPAAIATKAAPAPKPEVIAAKPAPKPAVIAAKPTAAAKAAPHVTKAAHHKAGAARPAAPAAKPKSWDPDALFFEKK